MPTDTADSKAATSINAAFKVYEHDNLSELLEQAKAIRCHSALDAFEAYERAILRAFLAGASAQQKINASQTPST